MLNSALLDSGSVEIPGLLGYTVTTDAVIRVHEYLKYIKEKVSV